MRTSVHRITPSSPAARAELRITSVIVVAIGIAFIFWSAKRMTLMDFLAFTSFMAPLVLLYVAYQWLLFRTSRNLVFRIEATGIRVAGPLTRRLLRWSEFDLATLEVRSGEALADEFYRLVKRRGSSLGDFREGWFTLVKAPPSHISFRDRIRWANSQNVRALLFMTAAQDVVWIRARKGYVFICTPENPHIFVSDVRAYAPAVR